MLESKENQTKLDSNQDKYLIINPAGFLDAIVTSRVHSEDDLVIRELEEGLFSILKDGKQIIKHLEKLTTEYGYAMVLYSNRKEHQIIYPLDQLDEACKRGGLNGFPKITTMIVKDREAYHNVRANDPKVAEGRSHAIFVAGYSLQSQKETEILNGCSKLLHFSKLEQNRYVILDNRSSFLEKAKEEGWNVCDTRSISLKNSLKDLCQKSPEFNNQNIQENFEKHTEEEKNAEVETTDLKTESDSTILTSEALDSHPQNSIYSNYEAEQQNLVRNSSDAIVNPTANTLGPSLDSLKTSDSSSQKFFQMNVKVEADKTEKEEADSNQFKELKDWQDPSLLPSDLDFRMIEGKQPIGSSPSLRWFVDKATNFKWVGKCSTLEIYSKNHFFEYKEFLGSMIYKYFGVRTPKIVFSELPLGNEIQRHRLYLGISDIDQPRFHLMSSVVPGFELLSDEFIQEYKASSGRNKKQLFYVKGKNKPLIGFGKVVAVSILIHDYDFVGNSAKNIFGIPSENGEFFEILKIDSGESLSFAEDMSGSKQLYNPPSKRGAVAGSSGERINFDDLNDFDKRECVETLKEILAVKDSTFEKLFTPFLNVDVNFRIIFEEFLNRRKELLAAFDGEVESLIERYIRELQDQQAAEQMSRWGKLPLYLQAHREKKDQLIINKAQLGAFTTATNTNSTETKILQTSSHKKVNFIGRESELSQIKKLFSENTEIIGCAIVGGPGLGKSQLATEFISRNQKEMYSEIVWLYAEKSDLIADQMQVHLETCHKIKFDNQEKNKKAFRIKMFYQTLEKEDGSKNKSSKKPCIVFDNADSMAEIAEYLPDNKLYPKLKIDIIVTSRFKKWDEPLGKVIEMQAFDVEEMKKYIIACIPRFEVGQYGDQLFKDTEKLNDLIAGLPLALSLAVAYIQQRGISISEFCGFVAEENNKEFISLRSQKISEKDCAYQKDEDESKNMNSISTIFTLALVDIRLKNHSAEPVLDILGYLSPDQISIGLLKDCWIEYLQKSHNNDNLVEKTPKIVPQNSSHQFIQEIRKELLDIDNNHEEKNPIAEIESFDMALDLLLSYSIITSNPIQYQPTDSETASIQRLKTDYIRVHQLTQQVIRLNHEKSSVYGRIYENVFNWVLEKLRYEEKELEDVRRAAFLIPHAIHLEGLRRSIKDDEIIKLQELIGEHQLYGVGNYSVAQKYYQKALDIKANADNYGKDHPETGKTLGNLGNAWGYLGDYEKQKDLLTQAQDIFGKHYDKDYPETGKILGSLGNTWGSLGDYEKQKDLLTRALDIFGKHYGKDHPETGKTLINLSNAWGSLGDYEKQKDLLTQALRIIEKHYGKDHPSTGITLRNLGIAWGSLGDYEKQKDLLTRALVIIEKHYGKDHLETGVTLTNLGNAWRSLGDYEKQKDLLTRALVIIEKHYGKDHPETGKTLNNLGNAWGSLGDYEKQKDLLTQALVIKEKHYGKDHPETGKTLGNLGNAWGSLGDYEKQKDLLTRALVIDEKQYGKGHPQTGNTLGNLGNAWGSLGDYEKQKDLLAQSLVIDEKHYGKDHPSTGITLRNLSIAWGSLGDYGKQKDLLIQALVIIEKHYGKDHLETGVTLTNLGNAWGSLGDYQKKKDLLTQALVIKEKHYGKDHPETGKTLGNLGNAWGSLGDYEKQKDLLTQALVIDEKHYGKDHPVTGNTLGNLGDAWGFLGDYEKQKDLLTQALVIKEKHYGKDHPVTGKTLINLGNAWGSLGDYEKQKDLLTQALVIIEKHYGKDHPETGKTLNNLGNAWGSLGDYEKQKDLLTRALVIIEKHYGKDHPVTGKTLGNLGNAWGSLGDYEKQKDLLTRALVIYEKHYGKDHPETGGTLGNLGNAWGSLGEYEKRKDLLNRALVIYEKHYGKDHPETGKALGSLGNAWGSLGDYEIQKDLLTRALVIDEKHYGKDHPETGKTLGNLGNAWGSLGDYEKQRDLLTQALDIFGKHYGKDHPETGKTLIGLSNAWVSLGEYEKPRYLLTKALNIFEKYYPSDHPYINEIKTSLNNLRQIKNLKAQASKSSDIKQSRFGCPSYNNFADHTTNILSWQRLANYYSQTTYLSKKFEIKFRKFNPLNKKLIILQVIVGNSHCLSKNYYKQSELLEQIYALWQKAYQKNQPINMLILLALATSCSLLKNYERQKILLNQALTIAQQEYGVKHLLTGIILVNLRTACLKPKESEDSFHQQKEAHEIFKKHFGEAHKFSQYSIHLLKRGSEEK